MLALTVANLKMLARNRQTTVWALIFPLILVVVFGLFDFPSATSPSIAIIDQAGTPDSQQLVAALGEIETLNIAAPPSDPTTGRRLISEGELDYLLVIPAGFSAGIPAEKVVPAILVLSNNYEERNQLVLGTVRRITESTILGELQPITPDTLVEERLPTKSVPYFDQVLFGLVGMGIMTHAIISIAVRISNYRNLSILKRMLVTPLAIWKFFAAEVIAQLVLAILQAAVIIAVGVLVFRAEIHGNVLHMLPVVALGGLVFLNIGFIISAWANSPAAASSMGNVVSFPMMLFAGTFFSTSYLPWLLPYAAEALPLAPMISALRDIAINEATLWSVWPQLAWLTGWAIATALMAVRVFRFS